MHLPVYVIYNEVKDILNYCFREIRGLGNNTEMYFEVAEAADRQQLSLHCHRPPPHSNTDTCVCIFISIA